LLPHLQALSATFSAESQPASVCGSLNITYARAAPTPTPATIQGNPFMSHLCVFRAKSL
jgi:hypothetical protein